MSGYDVDGISVWSVVVAEPPLFRQHFFQFVSVIALGFIGYANAWQAFFPFFQRAPRGLDKFLPLRAHCQKSGRKTDCPFPLPIERKRANRSARCASGGGSVITSRSLGVASSVLQKKSFIILPHGPL
jgi:hypothetical protein